MKVGLLHPVTVVTVVWLIHLCPCACFHPDDWNYYAILHVKRSAERDDILRGRTLCCPAGFIPTRTGSGDLDIDLVFGKDIAKVECDPQANEKMALLNIAYDTLKTQQNRQNYNYKYPKADLYMEPYDWEIPKCSGNQMKADFSRYVQVFIRNTRNQMQAELKKCFTLIRNIAALAQRWILAVDSMKDDDRNVVYGIFFAATASFVCSINVYIFQIKYFYCLVILWVIYLCVLHEIDSLLSLDLSFWKAFSLFQYLSFFVVYLVASVIATAYIFWTYKPHQNDYLTYSIYFLQLAISFHNLSQAKLLGTDFDLLLFLVAIIVISKILSKILTLLAQYLWSCIKEIFNTAANFILCLLKGLANIIMNIMRFSVTAPLIGLNILTVPIRYTVYFCGAMKMLCQKMVSTIKDLYIYCVPTDMLSIGPGRSNNQIQGRQLLTNEEYVTEGHFYTQDQLNRLRQDCQHTGFNVWREDGFLSDIKRFSSFISGDDHVTDAEKEEHWRSSHVYPYATDSESSDESD